MIQDSLDFIAEIRADQPVAIVFIVVFIVILFLAVIDIHRYHKIKHQRRDRESPHY